MDNSSHSNDGRENGAENEEIDVILLVYCCDWRGNFLKSLIHCRLSNISYFIQAPSNEDFRTANLSVFLELQFKNLRAQKVRTVIGTVFGIVASTLKFQLFETMSKTRIVVN